MQTEKNYDFSPKSTLPTAEDYGMNIDENDIKPQKIIRYKQDTKSRKWLAIWVVVVDSVWVLFLMTVIALQGFSRCVFYLENSVLIALLGTATANILGLAFIVLSGLFRGRWKPRK